MKKSVYIAAFVIGLFQENIVAQTHSQHLYDSCRTELARQKDDSAQTRLFVMMGGLLIGLEKYDSSRSCSLKGLELARKYNQTLLETKALNNIGSSYFYQGQYSEALNSWENSLEKATKLHHTGLINSAKLNIANVYVIAGNYTEALKNYYELLKFHEAAKNNIGELRCIMNIANVFSMEKDTAKALESYLKAENLAERVTEKPASVEERVFATNAFVSNILNIAQTYITLRDYKNAEEYLKKALTISEDKGLVVDIARSLGGIGEAKTAEGQFVDAMEYLERAIKMDRQSGDRNTLAQTMVNIACVYLEAVKNQDHNALKVLCGDNKPMAFHKARVMLDSAIAILADGGDRFKLAIAYDTRSNVESLMGDYKTALEDHIRLKAVNDSLISIERDKKVTQIAMQYEFDKKDAIARAMQEKKDIVQRNIRNSTLVGMGGMFVFSFVVYRQRNRLRREKKNVEKEKARSEELLLNILPAEVAEELKDNGSSDARLFEHVTVLFTDFVSFTKVSEQLTPQELVKELHTCFKAFDEITSKYNIEKIKTIGDAYLAVSGLPVADPRHAENVVSAAREINAFMLERRARNGTGTFDIRMGVHSGSVVAGIVGVKKFAYDIWGDTVNTAARMEQHCEVGRINLSGATFELVKDTFSCEYRGKIEVKGKGEMNMYYII